MLLTRKVLLHTFSYLAKHDWCDGRRIPDASRF